MNRAEIQADEVLDCWGLVCPVPVRKTAQALEALPAGQVLHVVATDEWFGPDLEAWLRHEPHELLAVEQIGEEIHAYLRKCPPHLNPLPLEGGEGRVRG